MQAAPCVQAPHDPLSQTSFEPHVVPLAAPLAPVSLQTAEPVEQSVEPVSQTLLGVHAAPWVQALHCPLSQTWLVPHDVPLAVPLAPVSVQTAEPVEQSVEPVSQTLLGVQTAPWVQALHCPLSQTWLVPHAVPLAPELGPESLHTGAPDEQAIVPVSHGLLGVQEVPFVQALHEPLSQTSLVPHEVPLAMLPLETQTEVPVVQLVTPVWQGAGVHASPGVHASQVPLSHTPLVPHAVPSATLLPVSLHVPAPDEQETVPV